MLIQIVRICRSLFKSSYLKNKKHVLGFLFHLWSLHQILNIFKKKKIVIANVFPKLATVQSLVTPLTIQHRLKTSFDSQHVKQFQTLVESSWKYFDHIFSSLLREMVWKISPWLKFEIIVFFGYTWTPDYKYSFFFFLFIITYTSTNYTKIKKEKIYIYIYIYMYIYKTIHTHNKPYCSSQQIGYIKHWYRRWKNIFKFLLPSWKHIKKISLKSKAFHQIFYCL